MSFLLLQASHGWFGGIPTLVWKIWGAITASEALLIYLRWHTYKDRASRRAFLGPRVRSYLTRSFFMLLFIRVALYAIAYVISQAFQKIGG